MRVGIVHHRAGLQVAGDFFHVAARAPWLPGWKINVPDIMARAISQGLDIDEGQITYYVRQPIIDTPEISAHGAPAAPVSSSVASEESGGPRCGHVSTCRRATHDGGRDRRPGADYSFPFGTAGSALLGLEA